MTAAERPDGLDVLRNDHRRLEELIRRLEVGQSGPDEQRKADLDKVTVELAWHYLIARRYVSPLIRRVLADNSAMADAEASDMIAAEETLKVLETKQLADPRFEKLVEQLTTMVRKHIDHEEHVIFPELAQACGQQELLVLGEEIVTARRLVSTPTPAASAEVLAEIEATGSPASTVDRVRAALDGAVGA
jgi:hypothetical protein